MAFLGLPAWIWGLFVVFLLAGMFLFPILSLIIGPILPPKYRKPFGTVYLKIGAVTLDRMMCVFRKNGTYEILPSRYEPESEAEFVHIDGAEREFTDPSGLMGSFQRRPFGIAVESVSAVLNPAVAAVGEAQEDKLADGEGYVKAYWDTDDPEDEGRGEPVVAMNPYTRLKESDIVVDMRRIYSILEGSSDSDMGRRVHKRALAAAAGRVGDKGMLKLLPLLGALIVGWILRDVSVQSGGGGGPVINMPFTVLPGWAFDVLLAGGL